MSTDFPYDPVTAIDESSATGEIAAIFADIRDTLGIPLVTSIWRGLAGMEGGLGAVWNAVKPIYLSGLPQLALQRVIEHSGLPAPQPINAADLHRAGIDANALAAIRTIVAAYNRSNGLNLVALAGLVAPRTAHREPARPCTHPTWHEFPALMSREAIDRNTWELIRQVNALGAAGIDSHVATLWRHLGHWPPLLELIHSAFTPAHADGSIQAAATRMVNLAQQEASNLASWRDERIALPLQARETIVNYVSAPTQVARMVTLGHALANWLAPASTRQQA